MAVNGVTGTNILLPPALAGGQGTARQNAAQQIDNTTSEQQQIIQQNAELINETLRNLGITGPRPDEASLFNTQSPFLAILQTIQELNDFQQSVLQLNETLLNLNFVPPEQVNPLLINELPPALEAAEIIDELNPIQQTDQLLNETLQDIGLETTVNIPPQPPGTVPQETLPAEEEPAAPPAAAASQIEVIALPETEAATVAAGAATPAATVAPTVPAVETTVLTVPIAANFQTPVYTPATLPLTLYPDRTPYVLAVYQPNDPAPQPGAPEPIDKEVPPLTPVTGVSPVGNARYRQALLRARAGELAGYTGEYNTARTTMAQVEKSIIASLGQANADLAAHGLDLHLVFAKHEDGFALDVYDCSYNEACRLSYDIAISLDNVGSVLGNLQNETGVIIDTTS